MRCCRETFAGLDSALKKDWAKHIAEAHPNGECENVSVGPHNNGAVNDSEWLVRLCIHPIHFNEKEGKLDPTAAIDVYRHGLSTSRGILLDAKRLAGQIEQKQAVLEERGLGRKVTNVSVVQARDVRRLTECGTELKALAVYDTSLDANPAHADIFGKRVPPKTVQRSVREELAALLSGGLVDSLEPASILEACNGAKGRHKADGRSSPQQSS